MNDRDEYEQFLRLFAKDEARVRRYIMVLVPHWADVDDIFQETTVALWRKFEEYQVDQPFLNWACRFAHFQVLSHRKREAVRRKHLQFSDAAIEALSAEPLPSDDERTQWRTALAHCVKSLPAGQRDLIDARYATNATVADLATQTGRKAKALYKTLARIRSQLAECVQQRLAIGGGR